MLKTLSPDYQEAFVKECRAHGFSAEATAMLFHAHHIQDLLENEPAFVEGMKEGLEKAANSLTDWMRSGMSSALGGFHTPDVTMMHRPYWLNPGAGTDTASTAATPASENPAELPSNNIFRLAPTMAGFHPPGSEGAAPTYPTAFHPQLMNMRTQLDAIDKETNELRGSAGSGGGAGYLHYHDVQSRLGELAQQRQELLHNSGGLLNRMHADVNDANQSLDYTQNVLDPALAERKQMSTTLGNSLYRNDKAPWYDATRWIPRAWDAITNAPGRLRDNESEVANLQEMQQQLAERRKELAQVPFPDSSFLPRGMNPANVRM